MDDSPEEKKQSNSKQSILTPDSSPTGGDKLVHKKIKDNWEMNRLENLSFAEFIEQNPSSVNLQIIDTDDDCMLFVDEFIVSIEISNLAYFQVQRTFDEFFVFYQALAIKLPQVDWPDFIKESGAFANRRRLIKETLQTLQELLKSSFSDFEQALGLVYIFFIDQKGMFVKQDIEEGTLRLRRDRSRSEESMNTSKTLMNVSEKFKNLMEEYEKQMKIRKAFKLKLNEQVSKTRSQDDLSLTKSDQKKDGKKFLGFWAKKTPKKVPPLAGNLEKLPQSNSEPAQISRTEAKIEIDTLIESLADASIWKNFHQDDSNENSLFDEEIFQHQQQKSNNDSSKSRFYQESGTNASKTRQLLKLSKQEIPNFSGFINMRFSVRGDWTRYFVKIKNSFLNCFKESEKEPPVVIIPCFRATLKYIEGKDREFIEMFHGNDAERIQIIINPIADSQNDSADPFKNLRMWYMQLKIATNKTEELNLPFSNYYPIGKLQLIVLESQDIRGLHANSVCYIRITHIPYTLQTSNCQSSDSMKWKQTFLIPLCDPFLPLKMELVCVYNEGWLKGTRKEEVVCTGEILVPDVVSIRSNHTLGVKLNFQYTESKKKHLSKSLNACESEIPQPCVKVKIKNLSDIKSLFAPSYGDYVEGVVMYPETYVKQHFKLSIRRVRRIIRCIGLFIKDVQTIFRFKFPFFSYCCFLLFSYVIAFEEFENWFANLILLLVLLCIYNHQGVNSKIKPIFVKCFFKDSDLNSHYLKPRIKIKEDVQTQKDLNTEKWKYKIVDEDNLVTQLIIIKNVLAWIAIALTKFAGFCEKLKNLVMWVEPLRTSVFICLGLIAYCILAVLPFRWTFLFLVWANFGVGVNYYKNLRARNKEVAKSAINFIVKRHFPVYYQQIWKNTSSIWPTSLNLPFSKKMAEYLNYRLGVVLPADALYEFKTPNELIEALSTCPKALKFKTNPEEKANLALVRWKKPGFTFWNFINFIMNTPSDYYRVIHPMMLHEKHIILEE